VFRYAICNELYRDWTFAQAFAHARDCGYEGIEIAPHTLGDFSERFGESRRDEVLSAAKASGLQVIGLHWLLAETSGLHWTADDAATRRHTAEYLARLTQLCADLGGRVMVLGSPRQRNLPERMSLRRGLDNAASVLEQLLPALAKYRIVLAIEPLGPEETNFLNTAEEVCELLRRFDSPWLRLHLDTKAMTTEARPIQEIIAGHKQWLAHFHANDPNRRGPGMGQLDFVPILRSLVEVHYAGWVSVEVFDESPGIDILARESIHNLKRDYAKAIAL
jgi:sugar phosphate isomerase/epimerase